MTDALPSWPSHVRALRIGEVFIDLMDRRILHPQGETDIPSRMFDVLLVLLAEPHRLHRRAELLQRVWPNLVVEDANLTQTVWVLRRALGRQRKEWIRTVARQGYVFEPPEPVQACGTLPAPTSSNSLPLSQELSQACEPPASLQPAPDASQAPDAFESVDETGVARARRSRWMRTFARAGWQWPVLALVALLVLGLGLVLWPGHPPAPARSVSLNRVDAPGAPVQARFASALLHAWLEWKLSSMPEVSIVESGRLGGDALAGHVTVVIAANRTSDDPNRLFVEARVDASTGGAALRQEGTPSEVGGLVDALSIRVVASVLPDRKADTWPVLAADSSVAEPFLALWQARQRRDWLPTAAHAARLLDRAPGFALAHLHRAQALAALGRLPEAQDHLAAAADGLHPLPADAAELFAAQRLALSPRHADAADAYATLRNRFPAQAGFSLQHARALGRAGRFGDALEALASPVWEEPQPMSLQIARWINRAGLESWMGRHPQARASAFRAVALARGAGDGWDYERGQAWLALAEADVAASGGELSSDAYEKAALAFDRAGHGFSARRARFLAEVSGPYRGPSRHLGPWLAETRASGQRQLELGALRAAAFQQYRAGEIDAYRRRLDEVEQLAKSIGDDWGLAAVASDRLNEALMRGDEAAMQQALRTLDTRGVQGSFASWSTFVKAQHAFEAGEYKEARTALERQVESRPRGTGFTKSAPLPLLACLRARLALQQGDTIEARSAYDRCRSGDAYSQAAAGLGRAEIDLLTGNRDAALGALLAVERDVDALRTAPDRWTLSVELAALLLRAGDSARATARLEGVLPMVRRSGYARLEAHVLVGLAEAAVVRGDRRDATDHLARVRQLPVGSQWQLRHRALSVEAALAEAAGDPASAARLRNAVDDEAHRRGDALVQSLGHSRADADRTLSCARAARPALQAASGLRGASLAWLQLPVTGTTPTPR